MKKKLKQAKKKLKSLIQKPSWLEDKDIKPYVFVREENRALNPGVRHQFDWFDHNYLMLDPLKVSSADFGHAIMRIDASAFKKQNMVTPPWVFYDCGVLPGIIVGYAIRTEKLPLYARKELSADIGTEWTPISMFIAIPSVQDGTWMAHNLASINAILKEQDKFHFLGFYTKAFGLWYANIERLYGVTQWHSPALKLHPNFGEFQLITTYTPLHDYSNSVTYCCIVNSKSWLDIIDRKKPNDLFKKKYEVIGTLKPKDEKAIGNLQKRLEKKGESIFLSGLEILNKDIGENIQLYRKRKLKK